MQKLSTVFLQDFPHSWKLENIAGMCQQLPFREKFTQGYPISGFCLHLYMMHLERGQLPLILREVLHLMRNLFGKKTRDTK
jgi:hypothetical protein